MVFLVFVVKDTQEPVCDLWFFRVFLKTHPKTSWVFSFCCKGYPGPSLRPQVFQCVLKNDSKTYSVFSFCCEGYPGTNLRPQVFRSFVKKTIKSVLCFYPHRGDTGGEERGRGGEISSQSVRQSLTGCVFTCFVVFFTLKTPPVFCFFFSVNCGSLNYGSECGCVCLGGDAVLGFPI